MDQFPISASEAFLIGMVVGKTSRSKATDYPAAFKHTLDDFVPCQWQVLNATLDTLPADAVLVTDDVFPFHRSSTYHFIVPNPEVPGGFVGIAVDTSRKSLTDLLSTHALAIHQRITSAVTPVWNEETSGKVKPEIEHWLETLIVANRHKSEYESGQLVGRMIALLNEAEAELFFLDEMESAPPSNYVPTTREFEVQRGEILRLLSDNATVIRCDVVRDLLTREYRRWTHKFEWIRTAEPEYDDFSTITEPDVLDELTAATRRIWLAVGVLHRFLYESESDPHKPLLPREFLSIRIRSIPALRMALEIAEQELHAKFPRYAPQEIARPLIVGIEPLVKDLWSGEVGDVLHQHKNSTDRSTEQFAKLAELLLKQYRNDAVHEGGPANCTWPEALFIYSSVRRLLELHEALKTQQPRRLTN